MPKRKENSPFIPLTAAWWQKSAAYTWNPVTDEISPSKEQAQPWRLDCHQMHETLLREFAAIKEPQAGIDFLCQWGSPSGISGIPALPQMKDLIASASSVFWLLSIANGIKEWESVPHDWVECISVGTDSVNITLRPSKSDDDLKAFPNWMGVLRSIPTVYPEYRKRFQEDGFSEKEIYRTWVEEIWITCPKTFDYKSKSGLLTVASEYLRRSINAMTKGITPCIEWQPVADTKEFILAPGFEIDCPWTAISLALAELVTSSRRLGHCPQCGCFYFGRDKKETCGKARCQKRQYRAKIKKG
jgi:hypothetical protein